MIINHNLSAVNANRVLSRNDASQNQVMGQVSSGLRITKAGDDAAGLAVAEQMRTQVRGLNQAVRNINDGINFIQTAEGYLQNTVNSLQRMRELSVQASTGTYSDEDRVYIQVEVSQLVSEINRTASQAQFNGMNLLEGRFDTASGGSAMRVHLGANMDQISDISIRSMTASALGVAAGGQQQQQAQPADPNADPNAAPAQPAAATSSGAGVDVSSAEGANVSIGVIDNALAIVNKQRADLGAYQNRLELASRSQMMASENMLASESQIRDLNMAEGMVDLTRDQILVQAGTAMLAQANMKNQGVLRLLG